MHLQESNKLNFSSEELNPVEHPSKDWDMSSKFFSDWLDI